MTKLVLIDGHAILHRAYHAFPMNLKTRRGELVNAVYGFTKILLNVITELNPECIAVAFDLPGQNFRHHEFVGYQAQRPKTDNQLIDQIDRVKEVVEALNIPIFTLPGFEADDVIGTLAQQAVKLNTELRIMNHGKKKSDNNHNSRFMIHDSPTEVIIVTGDKDILQLVDDHVKVLMPQRGFAESFLVDKDGVKQKMGVLASQIVDYKGLVGDPSDNYPGVLGIGPKTAINLLNDYKTLDGVYNNLDNIKNEKLRQKLIDGKENAYLSYKLATIVRDAPVKLEIDKCAVHDYDLQKVSALFEELEFRSLIKKLPGAQPAVEPNKPTKKVADIRQQSLF